MLPDRILRTVADQRSAKYAIGGSVIKRLTVLISLVAVFSLAFAGPALAAADVSNDSGEALVAQAFWGVSDETGAGDWGLVAASIQDGQSTLFLDEQSAVAATCDNGTPDDLTDDYAGLQGTFRTAVGPADVDIAANLKAGSASATLTIYSGVIDVCAGMLVTAFVQGVEVSLELAATGELDPWVDRFYERLPGEFNILAILRSVGHPATGTLAIGTEESNLELGLISRNRWNGHFNGR